MKLQPTVVWIPFVLAAALVFCCSDSQRVDPDGSVDGGGEGDADSSDADGGRDSSGEDGADAGGDGGSGDDADADTEADVTPPLDIRCEEDGSATHCTDDECTSLGSCPLGCDEEAGACYVPSNVPAEAPSADLQDLVLDVGPVTIRPDLGALIGPAGHVIRPAVEGLDESTGISFALLAQEGGPDLGVFSLRGLTIASGVVVRVYGENPLVVLASGPVVIDGVIDAGAQGSTGGSGGHDGGGPATDGHGPGAGLTGVATDVCVPSCLSGAGGGGHGGSGGAGGSVSYDLSDGSGEMVGGAGGDVYGTARLVPLVGGSGGGGGIPTIGMEEGPGDGGGGGGALQITSLESIAIGAAAGITAPGDGGGEGSTSGGAGGGAGGAILLEAPTVTLAETSFLAANGGGGGGGDCS